MFDWVGKLFSSPPTTATADDAEACKNRGNTHLAKGEFDAALACYQQAIAINPDYAEAFNNLGFICLQQHRFEDARRHLDRAIALNPKLPNAHYNLGSLAQQQGLWDEAIASYHKTLELKPNMSIAYGNLSHALRQSGQSESARLLLLEGISLNPSDVDLLGYLANWHEQENNFAEAITCFEKALSIRPDHVDLRCNLGNLLLKQGRLNEAIACFQQAIVHKADSALLHERLGDAFQEQNKLNEAIACYRQALSISPDFIEAHNNLGATLQAQGRIDEAVACFRHVLSFKPGFDPALYNLGLAQLAGGRLTEGWKHHEFRFCKEGSLHRRDFPHTHWTGESLAGRSLLIWCEQGIGDEILFASMFPEMIARAGRCVIECAPKLVPLFARSFPSAHVVARTDPPSPATLKGIDSQIAAGSLAQWLRPTLESFPHHDGYLVPDPARIAYWQARLAALGPGLKLGFCWRSSVLSGRHLHYTNLDQWGPIFAVPGVHFINLQYDECGAELAAARQRFGLPLHAFEEVDLFNDLDEAAALTRALDLVITAPTAVSRLAAAQGVTTWEMAYGTTWVALGTDHIPWLPAQRLFTRRWNQDWEEIIAAVAEKLSMQTG